MKRYIRDLFSTVLVLVTVLLLNGMNTDAYAKPNSSSVVSIDSNVNAKLVTACSVYKQTKLRD